MDAIYVFFFLLMSKATQGQVLFSVHFFIHSIPANIAKGSHGGLIFHLPLHAERWSVIGESFRWLCIIEGIRGSF